MAMPFCGLTWLLYVPFSLLFMLIGVFADFGLSLVIAGFLFNLIGCVATWLVWKYVVPLLSGLPIAGMLLAAIQPAVTLIFKIWSIILLIIGPIFIVMCNLI